MDQLASMLQGVHLSFFVVPPVTLLCTSVASYYVRRLELRGQSVASMIERRYDAYVSPFHRDASALGHMGANVVIGLAITISVVGVQHTNHLANGHDSSADGIMAASVVSFAV